MKVDIILLSPHRKMKVDAILLSPHRKMKVDAILFSPHIKMKVDSIAVVTLVCGDVQTEPVFRCSEEYCIFKFLG